MSTLQSADQYRQASWLFEIGEEGGSIEAQWEERREAKKRKRSKNISMQCQGCGNEFFLAERRGKFCSHKCYAKKSRRQSNFIQCMKCLQSLGFGIKAIGRQVAISHVNVRMTMIRAGVYQPQLNNRAAANREIFSSTKHSGKHCSGYAISKKRQRTGESDRRTPIQKTRAMLRSQIHRLVESARTNRQCRTEEYVGCSFDEAKRIIESKFEPDMSWDNYGTAWEIDHIKPMSSFDLSDPKQVMMVNHISNLQPMNPSLNRSKGNKIIPKKITRLLS